MPPHTGCAATLVTGVLVVGFVRVVGVCRIGSHGVLDRRSACYGPGVDAQVELIRVDRHRRPADRRVARRYSQPAERGDPSP